MGRRWKPPPPPSTAASLSARPRIELWTTLAGSLLAAATIAFGLIAKATGLGLGTALPPFFMTWDPQLDSAAPLWLAAFAAAIALAVWLARGFGSPAVFLTLLTASALLGRLALAGARAGTDGWFQMFGSDPEAANEYLPALPALKLGVPTFLDRFAELAPSLPIHPSAHPPGLLLLLDLLGIDTAEGMATLVIAAGLAAIPLTYLAARRLDLEEGRARIAALLLAFSPGAMIYGVASADSLFMTLGIGAVALLVADGPLARIGGAIALAVASFFSWALLAVGAFATLVVLIRDGLWEAIRVGLICAAGLLVLYGILFGLYGYDPIGVFRAAKEAYELGISNARPFAYWLFGSPVAFFVATGLPIAWYFLRSLGRGTAPALALAAVIAISALGGFSKAENERIWLFMAPLACIAAAYVVPRERMAPVLGVLAAEAIAIELLMSTVW